MDQQAIRRTESRFRGAGDRSLLRRSWLAPEPERALVMVHGLAEHSGRYDQLGAWFARRGCAVLAYDQRGHGESAGRRGHVRSFDDLLDDLAIFLELVRSEHPALPLFLAGHSMGGLVVTAFVRERHPDLIAVVVSGATLALPASFSSGKIVAVRLLRRLLPRLALDAGLDPAGLSRDPEVMRRYVDDPLVFSRVTVSMAVEMLSAMERSARGGAAVALPMLLLHGAEDPICLPSGSTSFRDSLLGPGHELRIYPGLRHEIFNEPEREEIFSELLEWIRERQAETK